MNFKQKARIALSAIAVFAVIGGSYAFKATREDQQIYTRGVNNLCTVTVTSFSLLRQVAGQQPAGITTATDVFGQPCVNNINYYTAD